MKKRLVEVIGIVVGLGLFGLLAGAIGGSMNPNVNVPKSDFGTITYSDFIAIMLTAVSVLLTILAFIVAIAAYVGWTSINTKVNEKVESYLRQGFKPGNSLHKLLVEKKNEVPLQGVAPFNEAFSDDAEAEMDKDY